MKTNTMPPISDQATDTDMYKSTASTNEHCVPVSGLAMEGTAPEVGDEVTYTVRGTVARIEGKEAYIKPMTVNDEPMPQKKTEMDEDNEMMALAMAADETSTPA